MGIEVFGRQPRARRPRAPKPGIDGPPGDTSGDGTRSRGQGLGLLAVLLVLAFAVVHVVAIVVATGGGYVLASQLAIVAIVGTIITLVLGIGTFVLRAGRRWGAVAVVLSIVANPIALRYILDFFGTATSAS
jgi:hypothetical protein